jgi:hypothetical protein
MKIKIGTNELTSWDLFKAIWRGWFFGVTTAFLGSIILLTIFTHISDKQETHINLLYIIPAVPIIVAVQGLIISSFIVFGLKINTLIYKAIRNKDKNI